MSLLKVHNRKLRLSKTQEGMLERSLRDLANRSSKQHAKELDERFRYRHGFGQVLEAELRRVGFDVERLRRFARQENARPDKAFMARVKAREKERAERRGSRATAVLGLTPGSANPPYDFTFMHHTVIGPGENWNHEADPNTGRIYVRAGAGDSRPREVHSFAALGFTSIPHRVGVLSVSIAPPVYESGFTQAWWVDLAWNQFWISLGITSYPRTPPGFTEVIVVDRDLLWSDITFFFDRTKHQQDRPAYSMSVSTLVDPFHNYACWAQLEAAAHGENGGGHAESQIVTTVGSFTYTFSPPG